MFSWSLGFERSAPKHVRYNHHCTGQVRNQPVVMYRVRIEHNVCVEQTWTAGLPRPLGAWVSDGPHPEGAQVRAWGKPDTQGPLNTKETSIRNPARGELA